VAGDATKWVREQAELVFDENGNLQGGIGTVQDITDLKQYEQKIEQMAFFDLLTQLPNRRMLYDRLGHTIATGKRNGLFSALMFIDLDNFKPLNDQYGHVAGDLLLAEVAKRLTGCVRESDTVARFGGDEFVVLLCELDRAENNARELAFNAAEKIRTTLAQSYLFDLDDDGRTKVEHHCTSSIGVVVFNGQKIGTDDILIRADAAMYRAKEDGRNLIRFHDFEF
jgi:diguanylate cyclase (GGDEF)-like protein